MSKLGFRFHAVPRDRHPEWFEVSGSARAWGLELYCAIRDEKTGVAEVAVAERWSLSLCKLLRVEPDERQAVCRHFESLHRHGLLIVDSGRVRVVFRADEDLGPRGDSSRQPQDGSSEGQDRGKFGSSRVKRSLTIGNDSGHDLQIRREEKRSEESESAREPELKAIVAVEEVPGWIKLGRHYQQLHDAEQEGTRNPRPYDEQRITSTDSKQFRRLLELVNAEAARSGGGPKQIFEAAALAFLRDSKQREKGLVLSYFVSDFTRYVDRSGMEAAS
jgi:hypothetical protein